MIYKIIPIFCLHDIPASTCDMVDLQYFCPLVIHHMRLHDEPGFRSKDKMIVYSDSNYKFYKGTRHQTSLGASDDKEYNSIYHGVDYHVYMKSGVNALSINDMDIELAVSIINYNKSRTVEALAVDDHLRKFRYFRSANIARQWIEEQGANQFDDWYVEIEI